MSDAISINSAPDRRWLILGVIGLGQVMVIMSLTVMNIALLSAQQALHFSTADRQWVVTTYTLAFGSLLLLGGRLAHGYDTVFWWTAGIFAGGAVLGGALLRPGPLRQMRTPSPAPGTVTTAQAEAGPARPA
jgi:MFS family permease